MEKLVLTIEEGRKALGIGRNSMYEAVRRGEIPALRIGRRLVIPKAALDRILNSVGESKSATGKP